jgi:hypothetical protein
LKITSPGEQMKDPYSVPKIMQETYDAITALTDGFCQAKLNEEYADHKC